EAARRFSAKLKIIHVSTRPKTPLYGDDFGIGLTADVIEKIWEEAEMDQRRTGLDWAKHAHDLGVEAEFISAERGDILGEWIAQLADRNGADLIYLTASNGPLEQTFLGGTIRDVLATAKQPVLVVRSEKVKPSRDS
ncbi:MAG: universal stress protein, partial [Bdellovibrionota bacterium]